MKRIAWIVAALTYLTACGGAPTTDAPAAPIDDPTADAAPPVEPDAGAVSPDAAPVSNPDAAPPSLSPDAAPDAAPTPDPVPPKADAAPPKVDAAKPVVDAGRDSAPPAVDAGAGSDVLCVPPPVGTCRGIGCPDYVAQCNTLNRIDALIRSTFPAPCTEGARICGGIEDGHIPVTEPMICRMGVWRLGVIEYSPGQWTDRFECSQQCASGQICDP